MNRKHQTKGQHFLKRIIRYSGIVLGFMVLFYHFPSYGQTKTDINRLLIKKFQDYYNQNNPDSLFLIFSSELKKEMTLEKTQAFNDHLLGQLGKLLSTEIDSITNQNTTYYLASFERGILKLLISSNELGEIRGLFLQPYKAENKSTKIKKEEDLSIKIEGGEIKGTLLMSKKEKEIPLVILIAGSGPTDRNGNSIFTQNNSLMHLANELDDIGIASFRYDKRGIMNNTHCCTF